MNKIHLGCGQIYLNGYTNIDYPLDQNHSVQNLSVADMHINLLNLKYEKNSIDEIRLHHVFEHFSRPIALALLVIWNSWLKQGSLLRIETPNYTKMAILSINPFVSKKNKSVALRHIFGSQEEHWANHYEGYSKRIYKTILPLYGFKIQKIKYNNWAGTHNIEVFATKQKNITIDESLILTKNYLSNFILNESEFDLLNYWLQIFENQIHKSYTI